MSKLNNFHFLGVDCGILGGIAIVHPDLSVTIHDMPLIEKQGKFNQHDRSALAEIFTPYASRHAIAVVERVRFDSRDEHHKTSAEWLIRSHECVCTLLEVLQIPTMHLEVPQWRKAIEFGGGSDKELARSYAKKLYPQAASKLLKSKHGRSDALLMAHAARVLHDRQEVAA